MAAAHQELLAEAKQKLEARKLHEADALFEKALASVPLLERAGVASAAGRLAQRAGEALLAVRWYRRAGELAPRDPEHPHDRGIAHLEAGEVGLAAQAQAEAIALDAEHTGARAQRAFALEALGDDDGAARELAQLLARLGPQPSLHARLAGLREAARRATAHRLLGAPAARLQASHIVGRVFAREASEGPGFRYRTTFASLSAALDAGGRIERLSLLFDDMAASLSRSDLAFGGTTQDEDGRRVPLDEFTAAATVFLTDALGIEPLRARRVLQWLLREEAGRGPHRLASAQVAWLIVEEGGARRYGLEVTSAPEIV